MNSIAAKILLIEDNIGDADLIQEQLGEAGQSCEIVHVYRLGDGLERLAHETFDLVFLDLSLPDSHGIETVAQINRELPDVPVVVLTSLDDEFVALKSMQYGAQDYLVKGQTNQQILVRAIRYAIERHRLLRSLALTDDMTGLYNRRGFIALAEQHVKLANRTNQSFLLIFADLDGLKYINDTYGHHVGSQAIVEAAGLLRSVLRGADIIGRLGGDEFAIIAPDSVKNSESAIAERIQTEVDSRNAQTLQPFKLGLSIGFIECLPPHNRTIEELLDQADAEMYKEKKRRKMAQGQPSRG